MGAAEFVLLLDGEDALGPGGGGGRSAIANRCVFSQFFQSSRKKVQFRKGQEFCPFI